MMIKKTIVIIICIFSVVASLFSQNLTSQARWAAQPVIIDGVANEWANPLNFYDLKSRLMYGISNDSANLYLCFQNPDEKAQSKIFKCGMKVNIAVKGKSKHGATLSYPLPNSGDEEVGPGHTPDMVKLKSSFRFQNIMMITEGFALHNGMFPVNDSSVISVAINWDANNSMTYEIAIPFTEIYGSTYSAQDLAREITLHVEVSGLKKPRSTSAPAQAPMGAAGVVGARAMGGMNYQTNTGNKSPWYQTQEFKQKFILAKTK